MESLNSLYFIPDIQKDKIARFLTQNNNIANFLKNNYDNFQSIVNCPISINFVKNGTCPCDQDELLWLFFETANSLNDEESVELEDLIFDKIMSPNWFDFGEKLGFSVR